MSYVSVKGLEMQEKIKIRQYLEPLCAQQKTEGYVHVLPNNQAVVNVKNLKNWRRYRDGTEIMRLVSSALFPDPVRLVIRNEACWTATLICSKFDSNDRPRAQGELSHSLASALTQLYRFVSLSGSREVSSALIFRSWERQE